MCDQCSLIYNRLCIDKYTFTHIVWYRIQKLIAKYHKFVFHFFFCLPSSASSTPSSAPDHWALFDRLLQQVVTQNPTTGEDRETTVIPINVKDIVKEWVVKDIVKEWVVKDIVKDIVKEWVVKDIVKDIVKEWVVKDIVKEWVVERGVEGKIGPRQDDLYVNFFFFFFFFSFSG